MGRRARDFYSYERVVIQPIMFGGAHENEDAPARKTLRNREWRRPPMDTARFAREQEREAASRRTVDSNLADIPDAKQNGERRHGCQHF